MSMEEILRPFTEVTSTPIPRVPSVPAVVTPKAFIRWGKPSTFTTHDFRGDAMNIIFTTKPDPEPDKRIRRVYTLQGRSTDKVRWENKDDPDMYVVMESARGLHYMGPDNSDFQLHIKAMHDPNGETGDGQEPEKPPELGELNERLEWLEWHHRHPNS